MPTIAYGIFEQVGARRPEERAGRRARRVPRPRVRTQAPGGAAATRRGTRLAHPASTRVRGARQTPLLAPLPAPPCRTCRALRRWPTPSSTRRRGARPAGERRGAAPLLLQLQLAVASKGYGIGGLRLLGAARARRQPRAPPAHPAQHPPRPAARRAAPRRVAGTLCARGCCGSGWACGTACARSSSRCTPWRRPTGARACARRNACRLCHSLRPWNCVNRWMAPSPARLPTAAAAVFCPAAAGATARITVFAPREGATASVYLLGTAVMTSVLVIVTLRVGGAWALGR